MYCDSTTLGMYEAKVGLCASLQYFDLQVLAELAGSVQMWVCKMAKPSEDEREGDGPWFCTQSGYNSTALQKTALSCWFLRPTKSQA